MAQFFNGFAGQRWVDVEAHSYGAVVAVAGLNQSSLRPHNLILLGGPLSGTPIANAPYLFTALMNGFFNGGLVSPNTVSTFLSSGAAAALAPGAPSTATQTFAAEQPQTNVIKVGGSSTTLATVIAEFFTAVVAGEDPYGAIALATQPNDGIVPLSSAEASLLPGITLTYPLSHTQLTCTDTGSTTVVSDVAAHLERPTPSP
jgi:hypothetical protein